MASAKNDALLARTVEGSLNIYDQGKCIGTAADKGLAARQGGCSYNIVNNDDKHERYFKELRPSEHFVDDKNRHTKHFVGPRRRKFAVDERNLVKACLTVPDDHPRARGQEQRRVQTQLAQIENATDYGGFQDRCAGSLFTAAPRKRYSIDNVRYANEAEKLKPRHSSTKAEWLSRRGETMSMSRSAPSLHVGDPAGSLDRAMHADIRKHTSQLQTESATFAPWQSANTYSHSMSNTHQGQQMGAGHQHLSVHRIENHDFGVTKKNNHFSSHDKLTRSDPFFMRPRLGTTQNSVKYDIVNNERRWFKYGGPQ
mmetsp:Transcript_57802/g.152076  ORF Transcript_57802/g.152076 Transcript_57802/m.152076 type:complete len:312 (-) Transcript_57802:100-1035(-)